MTGRAIVAWVQPGTPPMTPLPVTRLMRDDPGVVDFISIISGPRIATARNEVVREFLKHDSKADWLFMVDTDMTFEPDIVARLTAKAEAVQVEHHLNLPPVMGALCFAGGRGSRIFPTLFQIVDPADSDGDPIRTVYDYPRGKVCKVDATGAACLLVHRKVLEAVHARYGTTEVKGQKIPFPVPWFAETVHGGREIGEDTTFCMRVGHVGGTVFVDTSTVAGHLKYVVLDEAAYDAQREREAGETTKLPETTEAPTVIVIPVRNQCRFTRGILPQLYRQGGYDQIIVFDNGSTDGTEEYLRRQVAKRRITAVDAGRWGFHHMWNTGLSMARRMVGEGRPVNVAFLNNDLNLGSDCIARMAAALRADPKLWAVCPNYDGRPIAGTEYTTSTFKNGGLAGFCFMLKGEAPVAFDEAFQAWFGDDDIVAQIEAKGYKVGICGDTTVDHIGGGGNSTTHDEVFAAKVDHDLKLMLSKWGHP